MNKNALITGGTRGIGEAIAREFAKKGYNLIINYVNSKEKAEKLKNELEEIYNIKVLTSQADLADEKEIENMVDIALKKFGKIDVLVNNAGIVIDKEFEDRTIEDWKQILNINLIAPFILTKLIGKEMVKNKSGAIINISSTNGINTYYPTSVDYDASKSGLISLTYDSAVELAPYVRVNCIAPGWVNTEMNKELPEDFAKEIGYNEIILQGHSYGCNKVIYYYNDKKDESIKKIVLLGPCDIQQECKMYLDEDEYNNLKTESARLVKEGKPSQLLDFSLNGNGKISAGTYYYDFLPNTETDFIRYREGVNSKSKELNNIDIPVLIVFGDMDECVLTQDIEIIEEYLNNNIKECNIQIIKGADHSFTDKYKELGEVINNNI